MNGQSYVTGSLVGDLRACANGMDLYASAGDRIVELEAACKDANEDIGRCLERIEALEGVLSVALPQMEAVFANPDALKNSELAINAFGATIHASRSALSP